MAKNRIINTKFWTDPFVLDELNPVDKLVFLYLLTNPYTDISGVYELPIKVMSTETGIDRDNIERIILPRFEKAGKILYRSGWIAIKNFIKHQSINPKVERGIQIGLSKAPQELRSFVGYSMDSLSHPNTNSNTKSSVLPSKTPLLKAPEEQEVRFDHNIDEDGNEIARRVAKKAVSKNMAAQRIAIYFAKKAIGYTGKPVIVQGYTHIKDLLENKKMTEDQLKKFIDDFFEEVPPDDRAANIFICLAIRNINKRLNS